MQASYLHNKSSYTWLQKVKRYNKLVFN